MFQSKQLDGRLCSGALIKAELEAKQWEQDETNGDAVQLCRRKRNNQPRLNAFYQVIQPLENPFNVEQCKTAPYRRLLRQHLPTSAFQTEKVSPKRHSI